MKFPEKPEDSEDETVQKKPKKPSKWAKTHDPDITDKSATATPTPKYAQIIYSKNLTSRFSRRASDTKEADLKQAEKPKIATKAKPETDESEEESEDEGEPVRKPRTSAIIGFRTIQTTGAGR